MNSLWGKCPWAIDWSCSRWHHVTRWCHNSNVIFLNASSPAILVRIGRYFNTMFPFMVCLYMVLTDSWSRPYDVIDDVITLIFVATLGLNISETKLDSRMVPIVLWIAYRKVSIGYRLGMLPMTSFWWCHDFSLKCFFSGNVPLWYVYVWSSRIVDPVLMTSLLRANLIIYWLVVLIYMALWRYWWR